MVCGGVDGFTWSDIGLMEAVYRHIIIKGPAQFDAKASGRFANFSDYYVKRFVEVARVVLVICFLVRKNKLVVLERWLFFESTIETLIIYSLRVSDIYSHVLLIMPNISRSR